MKFLNLLPIFPFIFAAAHGEELPKPLQTGDPALIAAEVAMVASVPGDFERNRSVSQAHS